MRQMVRSLCVSIPTPFRSRDLLTALLHMFSVVRAINLPAAARWHQRPDDHPPLPPNPVLDGGRYVPW